MTREWPQHPEVPYPFPPWRREPPERTEPLVVPNVLVPSSDPAEQLLDRRQVLVTGDLDPPAVNRLCAQLMALDGRSGDPVTLIVSGVGGPVPAVLPALDVLGLMRAPVDTRCTGAVSGTAAALVACGTGTRTASRTSLITLRCRRTETATGTAEQIAHHVEQIKEATTRLAEAIVRATNLDLTEAEAALDHGGHHGADEAKSLGLVDQVA